MILVAILLNLIFSEEIITYDLLINNANQHLRIGNYDEAALLVNRARIIKPSYEVFNLSGRIFYERAIKTNDKKYFKQAIESFKRCINFKKTASAYYNLGLAYLNIGDSKKAISAFNKSKEIDPKYNNANTATALLFLKLGDVLNAIEVYENILDENSDSIEALVNVACLYAYNSVAKEELEHAKEYASRAIKIDQDNQRATNCLNHILHIENMQNQRKG